MNIPSENYEHNVSRIYVRDQCMLQYGYTQNMHVQKGAIAVIQCASANVCVCKLYNS